ncbi:hypothetical protein R6Z07M_014427 [Ovis aries]
MEGVSSRASLLLLHQPLQPSETCPAELCSFPAIHLGPDYGGGNEDNGNLLQKSPCMYCYTQSPQPCNRPLLTHNSAGDSWTPTGKSGPVSCGVTAPFSWVFVHKVLFVPSRSLFPSPV